MPGSATTYGISMPPLRRLLSFLEHEGREKLVRRFFERFWDDCRLEADFFAEVFDLKRVTYMPDGRPTCTYQP